jgi:2-C-methyl-D-erythritol 4-phosphate cytidylyltransferase
MSVAGLLLAAGQGRRLGGVPKAQLVLHGRTLLEHGIWRLMPVVDEVVASVGRDEMPDAQRETMSADFSKPARAIEGGASRQESLHRLLQATAAEWVLVHEVARPLTPPGDLSAVVSAGTKHGAASLFRWLPVRDSIGVAHSGRLVGGVQRSQLVVLQTPQFYHRSALLAAHERAAAEGWSEEGTAHLAMRAGIDVHLVEGTTENLKVTYPEDWERLVRDVR